MARFKRAGQPLAALVSRLTYGFLYAASATPGLIFTSVMVCSARFLPPEFTTALKGIFTPPLW